MPGRCPPGGGRDESCKELKIELRDTGLMQRKTRLAWGAALLLTAAALFAGSLWIPFGFESPSILYKFGIDKVLLRTGKLLGIVAALLLLLQMPLAGRLRFLDRIFFLPSLYRLHRIDAWLIGLLVLLHPVCILIPEDRILIPLEVRYWPEWVGVGLLLLILLQGIFVLRRRSLLIPYHRWRRVHLGIGIAVAATLGVHVLFVSETFEFAGIPRTAVMILAGAWGLLWARVRMQALTRFQRPYRVVDISPAGKDAFALDLEPVGPKKLRYAPGQFAFFSFSSPRLSKEAHPFTLASSPSRPERLQVIIRCCGDWTDRIGFLREGDAVFLQGPYGGFTHLFENPGREIVMIAGGIGITPMWSMLRYMAYRGDPRPVTLLWSNQEENRFFGREELTRMQRHLTRFTWIPMFTRERGSFGLFGRLDAAFLEAQIGGSRSDAVFFICGPPEMIRNVQEALKQLGYTDKSIRQEVFGL